MMRKTKYLLASALTLLTHPAMSQTCIFQNEGTTYIHGPCSVSLSDSAVEIKSGKHKIELLLDETGSTAIGHWNSGRSKKYDYDLGPLSPKAAEDGLCWNGDNVRVCYEGLDAD